MVVNQWLKLYEMRGNLQDIWGWSSREGWLSISPAEIWSKAEVWCESSNEETGCPPSLTPQWTLQGRQRPGELGGEGPRCPCWRGTGISREPGARFGVWRLWEKDRRQEICSDLWSKSSNHLIWKQATEYQQVSWVRKEPVFSWMIDCTIPYHPNCESDPSILLAVGHVFI